MKALVVILGIIFLALLIGKRKKPKAVDTDDWKPNRNSRAKTWDSAGNETNPRRNLMCLSKKGGTVKVSKPFKD